MSDCTIVTSGHHCTSEQHLYQSKVQFDKTIIITQKTCNRKYTWLHFLLLPPSGYSIWGTENFGQCLHPVTMEAVSMLRIILAPLHKQIDFWGWPNQQVTGSNQFLHLKTYTLCNWMPRVTEVQASLLPKWDSYIREVTCLAEHMITVKVVA